MTEKHLFAVAAARIVLTGIVGADETVIAGGAAAWMLTSAALIVPGYAMFYGGPVRTKNVMGAMRRGFAAMGVTAVLASVNDAMSFDGGVPDRRFGCNPKCFLLTGIDKTILSATVPEYVFSMFQGKFTVITPLFSGTFAERVTICGYVMLVALWELIVGNTPCRWVWETDGFLFTIGAAGTVNFAEGTMVHISAGSRRKRASAPRSAANRTITGTSQSFNPAAAPISTPDFQ